MYPIGPAWIVNGTDIGRDWIVVDRDGTDVDREGLAQVANGIDMGRNGIDVDRCGSALAATQSIWIGMESLGIERVRHGWAMEPTSVGTGLVWAGMEAMRSEESRRGS